MARPRTTTRLIAEDCLHLWIHRLLRGKQTLTWEVDGKPIAHMDYERKSDSVHIPAQPLTLRPVRAIDTHYLPLSDTTQPDNDAVQQWFLCCCGHRVAKLYLPPGQREFRCRHCYKLTHRSAQTHDSRVNHLARHQDELIAALSDPLSPRAVLAVRAMVHMARWQKRGGYEKELT